MANEKVKQYAKEKQVFLWELGRKFGVKDTQFSRRLREEFTPGVQEQAMRYIDEIAAERETA